MNEVLPSAALQAKGIKGVRHALPVGAEVDFGKVFVAVFGTEIMAAQAATATDGFRNPRTKEA
ncbi:hypothetical protein [Deefgea piscis]|uniref:hypothetical protein n=1 Tax=Deefgea piscis TaxID=2739061 RepID=UPI001C7FFA68|nr:hypothetical protein [Deefgea piscis]QZA80874.1 hypothetical protein K4H25_15490 [Deefgea piscis]